MISKIQNAIFLQILEQLICPILLRFGSTFEICQSGILTLKRSTPSLDLEIPRDLLLTYLMDYQRFERWMLYGALICPGNSIPFPSRSVFRDLWISVIAKMPHPNSFQDTNIRDLSRSSFPHSRFLS